MTVPTEYEKKMDKYFYSHRSWTAGSQKRTAAAEGHLAERVDDPTFGDDSVYLSSPIYRCLVCGAAVLDPPLHADWHEQ